MKKILFVLFLSLSLMACMASSGWAGGKDDLKAGIEAHTINDYDKAIQLYTKAIESGELPRDYQANAYLNRGMAWSRKGDYNRAIADFNKAIELKPKYLYARAYYERACTYALKGEKDKARSDLGKAIYLDKDIKEYAKKREELKNLWSELDDLPAPAANDEFFKKSIKEKNLKEIQKEFENWLKYSSDPRASKIIRTVEYACDGSRVKIYITGYPGEDIKQYYEACYALACYTATEYYKWTGFDRTTCCLYRDEGALNRTWLYGARFDGVECDVIGCTVCP